MDELTSGQDGEVYLNVVLMTEEDRFANLDSRTSMVYRTLKELDAEYDNIELIAYNTTAHPELAKQYMVTELDTPSLSDVVIELCDENHVALPNSPAKKYAIESFFTTDSSSGTYVGYNAEAKLLSAVAQMLGKSEKPIAYYLQGHGEPSLAEAAEWKNLLELAGFEAREINLRDEDFAIPASGTANDNVLVINCPKYDLLSTTEISEVKKIRTFMGTNYGNLLVMEDSSVSRLPALEGLLGEYGLGFGGTVTDSQHSLSSSGATKVLVDYSQTYNASAENRDPATQIFAKVFGDRGVNAFPPTVFTNPKQVTILSDEYIVHGINGSAANFPLLQTYGTARTTGGSEVVVGSTPLIGLTMIDWDVNETDRSWVGVIGSSDFLNVDYEGSCANKSIGLEILNLMWNNIVSFDGIDFKEFDSYSLTVSTAQASAWTVVCVVVIPVLVAALGVYVYIRRRHS